MTDGTPPRVRRGLKGAAAGLAAALLGLGRTRLELAALEFEEVRARTAENLALVLVAAICFAFALLAASMLVVVLFWDTHRIAALVGMTVVYALIGSSRCGASPSTARPTRRRSRRRSRSSSATARGSRAVRGRQ